MNSPQEFLSSKLESAKHQILAGFIAIGLFITYNYFAIRWYREGFRDPETDPFAPLIVDIFMILLVIVGIALVLGGYKLRKRYLKYSKGESIHFEEIISDRYVYFELLPGDEGAIKNQYNLQMGGRNWRLYEDCEYAFIYPIGSKVKGVALSSKDSNEIISITAIKKEDQASFGDNCITEKVISDLEIKGIKDGKYQFNRMKLTNRTAYYLASRVAVKEVSKEEFESVKIGDQML